MSTLNDTKQTPGNRDGKPADKGGRIARYSPVSYVRSALSSVGLWARRGTRPGPAVHENETYRVMPPDGGRIAPEKKGAIKARRARWLLPRLVGAAVIVLLGMAWANRPSDGLSATVIVPDSMHQQFSSIAVLIDRCLAGRRTVRRWHRQERLPNVSHPGWRVHGR